MGGRETGSHHALAIQIVGEPVGEPTPSGKREPETTSQVWSHIKLLPLAEDGKKRCNRVNCGVL